jgi:hypothetical protein
VAETAGWSEKRWQAVSLATMERACEHFAGSVVLETLLEDWCALAAAEEPLRRSA